MTMTMTDSLIARRAVRPDRRREAPGGGASMPSDRDRVLLRRLQQHDPQAIAEIWRTQSVMVIDAARSVVRCDALAQEIAQDVFVTLWKKADQVDLDRGSLSTFLRTVARNRSADVVRRETSRRSREDRVSQDPSRSVGIEEPVDVVLRRERVLRIRAAVAELPPRQREAVELAWFGGHTYRQVAAALGVPEGTAKTRIRDGLRVLSSALADESELNCA